MTLRKSSILILTDWFVPGYKAGGPITSTYKMIGLTRGAVDYAVLTSNTDWHDEKPYSLTPDVWLFQGGIKVKYLSKLQMFSVLYECSRTYANVIYFNGIYSPSFHAFSLMYCLLFKANSKKLVVAPRGMLNENAIALKSRKKKALIAAYRFLGIANKVTFHSTGANETAAIREVFSQATIAEVLNVPAHEEQAVLGHNREGFLAVGRISKVKNTLGALEMLAGFSDVKSTFVGSADDLSYFEKCSAIVRSSSNLNWMHGCPPNEIVALYRRSKYFLSMTTGENFGHAIIEALSQGCPVLISDRTPWNDLVEAGAGWVIPLEDEAQWIATIKEANALDDASYEVMSANAIAYVKRKFDLEKIKQQYIELFQANN